jgi:hypothetical protein
MMKVYSGQSTIEEISDRLMRGASYEFGNSVSFYSEDAKTLLDYMASREKLIEELLKSRPVNVAPAVNAPQPVYTVKLETNALSEIKAMVDDGATLVLERGGGLAGWLMRVDIHGCYSVSTSGSALAFIQFDEAYDYFSVNASGRQIYVDYPIPPTAGRASPKSKAREELDRAKMCITYNETVQHLMNAVEALIEGAE